MIRPAVLVNATRALLIVGIAVQIWIAASFLMGPHGLGVEIPRLGGWVPEGIFDMHASGVLAGPPGVDIDLSWANTAEGAVDASSGLPAVELSGPYTAVANFLNHSRLDQSAYVLIGALSPILVAVVLWVLFRIVNSVGHQSPFTEANARRLWALAGFVGIGGTIASAADGWLDGFLISRSAAAPAFQTSQISFELWPLIVGLLVAVLALVWNRGVALEKDTEGLV